MLSHWHHDRLRLEIQTKLCTEIINGLSVIDYAMVGDLILPLCAVARSAMGIGNQWVRRIACHKGLLEKLNWKS